MHFKFTIQNSKSNLQTQHRPIIMRKQSSSSVIQSLNGPPVDFSFKNIRSLKQLLQQTKQKDCILHQEQQKKQQQQQPKKLLGQKSTGQQQSTENNANQSLYETKLQIVRTIEISQTKILDANKNASKKKQKNEKKPFKIVQAKSTALFLRYNKITSIQGLYSVAQKSFPHISNLMWIDLSFNRLLQLTDDFALFPNLKTLYLHSNYISDFKEIEKLAQVKQLRALTIHANPIQKFEEFRVLIASIVPQLSKIDTTLLTKRQTDRGRAVKAQVKKYPLIKNPQQRPQQSDNEDQA